MMDHKPKIFYIIPELCECGRLYKDRLSFQKKMVCSACQTGLSVESLKKLWGTPIFKKKDEVV